MKKVVLACLAGAALLATPALGADLRAPVKAPVAVAAPVFNWTGFYVGLHGGWAWTDVEVTYPFAPGFVGSHSPRGAIFGGQIGYNWQLGGSPWVWGIEADISGGNIESTEPDALTTIPLRNKIDYFGSVRGRIGHAVNRTLFYFTGGWGFARIRSEYQLPGIVFSARDNQNGWVIGGGVEHAIAPNWTIKAEYLYFDLGNGSYVNLFAPLPINLDVTMHVARAGVNYKF